MLDYVINHPKREDFDWLYILCYGMKKAFAMGFISPDSKKAKQFLTMKKLWDFQELCRSPREVTIETINELMKSHAIPISR